MSRKTCLVTGASRGIGRAVALELSRRGWKVYGSGRSIDGEEDLGFTPIVMDVTDPESVKAGVELILGEFGRLDAAVNNAGVSHCGSVEDTPVEVARRVFETNYFGLLNVTRAVLPIMRERGSGTIANVTSAAGKIGVPFQPHYAASKWAVEGLTEALWHEVKQFGVRVIIIEPGDVGTTIWENSKEEPPEGSAYAESQRRYLAVKAREMGGNADPPENAARQISDALEAGSRRLRYPAAKGAGLILAARKLLPDSLFLMAVGRNYKL